MVKVHKNMLVSKSLTLLQDSSFARHWTSSVWTSSVLSKTVMRLLQYFYQSKWFQEQLLKLQDLQNYLSKIEYL